MIYMLWHYLNESAKKYPTRPAVVWSKNQLTFRELNEQSTSLAYLLALKNIGRGDRVVGRTRWCDTPESASTVRIVGDAVGVNVEALLATRPDLVVAHSHALIDTLKPLAGRMRVRYIRNASISFS